MNEAGIAVLVNAALAGHPQGFGWFHTTEGDCALGVLHRELHVGWTCARPSRSPLPSSCLPWLSRAYDVWWTGTEHPIPCPLDCGTTVFREPQLIIHMNDDHRLDFLGIARKMGDFCREGSERMEAVSR